ncbi:MAG: exodeoxyribonuclease VII large subunit [Kiritimatiellae bacterium]|nr:exodeoxyribonuclease VII large subunit [Kiritimatiellia bacterium]MDD4025410.1 exodeoxyribonuclease VII large subunit [Kiritimatiellia bacterium]
MDAHSTRKIYSITELARLINRTLEDGVGRVWVEGELSGARVAGNYGYTYFTLKDAHAQLSGIMNAQTRRALPPGLAFEDGALVRIYGEVTFYEPGGKIQLRVLRVEAAGAGGLMLRFEELKRKLQAEGLFDSGRKKPLPKLPQRVGVVTSPTGAVIHDIITVLGRRFPNLQLRLFPVRVQGAGAADEIAAAVRHFNRCNGPGSEWPADVLIVGRGGGSLEDLWAFNEERVVRAVADSAIPVISAVGHESDVSLCDLAADVRAPTPSAAAELAVRPKAELEADIARHARQLRNALRGRVAELRGRLAAAGAAAFLRRPAQITERRAQMVDTLCMRMGHAAQSLTQTRRRVAFEAFARLDALRSRHLGQLRQRITGNRETMEQACARILERRRTGVMLIEGQLRLLSPVSVLERGYSLTRRADGRLLRSVTEPVPGDVLRTQVKDGVIESTVSGKMCNHETS